MADLREIPPERLKEILEVHRKWVESGGKEGKQADLREANLQKANLLRANLQEAYLLNANLQEANLLNANLQGAILVEANLQKANLRGARDLTVAQVQLAYNWDLAIYSNDILKKLGLPPDHNEIVKKKLAEY